LPTYGISRNSRKRAWQVSSAEAVGEDRSPIEEEGSTMEILHDRRRVLAGLTALGATIMAGRRASADQGPPEITTIRLPVLPGVTDC
jgi:hypothetical protein